MPGACVFAPSKSGLCSHCLSIRYCLLYVAYIYIYERCYELFGLRTLSCYITAFGWYLGGRALVGRGEGRMRGVGTLELRVVLYLP